MPVVLEANGAICVSVASVISESALGQGKGKFVASFTFGRTMRTLLFEQWFKDELLKALPKGRVIIMDNASFHKNEVLHKIVKEHSQTLIFLPPYCSNTIPLSMHGAL